MSLNLKFKFRLKLKNQGVTLIELLIALVISAILIVALYQIFIGQQKTYVVQEQVVDMQQNVRAAINKMMREIRMAGFGNVGGLLGTIGIENEFTGEVNSFTKEITPNTNSITIVGGFKQIRRDNGDPIVIASASGNQITLNFATDEFDGDDPNPHRFISIGGVESNTVLSRSVRTLTLKKPISFAHLAGTPIFKIQAITYSVGDSGGKIALLRNENTGGGNQPLAENIENIQFEYLDANGVLTVNPANILMVRVTVTARTSRRDPYYKGDPDYVEGEGSYRKRRISSNIQIRNMGVNP